MPIRALAMIVTACLCSSQPAAQAPANLTRDQRDLLRAIVTAVDSEATQSSAIDASWQTHVMRASDGSHYVAFAARPTAPLPAGPVLLYIRLSHAPQSSTTRTLERSLIRDWLAGTRPAPPPIARTGVAIGEMPTMGATGNLQLRPPTSTNMTDLQVMDMERRRAREQEEERARQRRDELAGRAPVETESLPFEDFDAASRSLNAAGTRVVSRALTAGPGDYVLYAAWADASASKPASTIRVIKTALRLPAASTTDLSISSIILADAVRVRDVPYPPVEQAAHPYAIGLTEVTPAADSAFASDENLSVLFQVINAQPSDAGKPDVEVASRIVRVTNDREQPIAALTPLSYSATSLPAQFDLRLGHPILAALSAPLGTLPRGNYRLRIVVNDRNGGRSAQADVDFLVVATAATLLKEAPPAPPFQRDTLMDAAVLSYLADALAPAAPSPALQRTLDAARAGRMAEVMIEEPIAQGEEGVRAVLTGLAQLSIGDTSSAVQFQRGVLLGAAIAPSRVLSGAARAMQGRDADAIAGWLEALKAGAPRTIVAPLLLEAYLRRNDYQRAAALVADSKGVTGASWTRSVAALRIADNKETEALVLLDQHLNTSRNDAAARWLRLHALYAQLVNGNRANRARFESEARIYIDAKGPHAELAAEWLRMAATF